MSGNPTWMRCAIFNGAPISAAIVSAISLPRALEPGVDPFQRRGPRLDRRPRPLGKRFRGGRDRAVDVGR